MFVITTDGMENASRRYTYEKVKQMIERQKTKYNWEFLFLGANIDAVQTAGQLGCYKIHIKRLKRYFLHHPSLEAN